MSFDSIPEDKRESGPCPVCGEPFYKSDGKWSCSACDWVAEEKTEKES